MPPELLRADQQTAGLASRAFVILCVISFLSNFAAAPFSALFPVYIEADVGKVPLYTAYLRTLMLALGGICAIVGGRLCDLLGLKFVLIVGLTGAAACGLAFQSTNFWIISCFVMLAGIASGPMSAASQSYLISSVGRTRLGIGGGVFFLSHSLGGSLGSFFTGVIKPTWNFQQIGIAMALTAMIVVGIAIALLPDISKSPTTRLDRKELLFWRTYLPLLQKVEVQLLITMRLCITGFWGMATLLLPLLIYRVSGDAATAAFYGSLSLAIAAGCQITTGWIRDRFGKSIPLLVSALGIAVCAAGLGLSPDSLLGLFTFGTGLTGTAWAVSVLVPSLIDEIASSEEKNRLVGLGHLAWSTSMAIGGIAGGVLVEINSSLPFFLGVFLALGGAACLLALCRRLDRQTQGKNA